MGWAREVRRGEGWGRRQGKEWSGRAMGR